MVAHPTRYKTIVSYIYGPVSEAYWQAIDSGAYPLTAAREFLDSMAGILPGSTTGGPSAAEIRADIIWAQKSQAGLPVGIAISDPPEGGQEALDALSVPPSEVIFDLQAGVQDALDFVIPQLGLPPDLIEMFADLLFNPTYTPGDPCLAAPPLLRDLLDMALGRAEGIIGQIFGRVGATVENSILPAFGGAQDLAKSIQAVLDDPITAALNMILGQRAKIDCVTNGGVGVGIDVINASIRHLEKELAEVFL